MMTNGEKERFCSFAATLFAPPGRTTVADLERDEIQSLIGDYTKKIGGDGQLQECFIHGAGNDETLSTLQAEYSRLFGEREERISLVLSSGSYRSSCKATGSTTAWTRNGWPNCRIL